MVIRSRRFGAIPGLSVTCHYRANPSLEPQVAALAQEVAAATGLVVRASRKSVEVQGGSGSLSPSD